LQLSRLVETRELARMIAELKVNEFADLTKLVDMKVSVFG